MPYFHYCLLDLTVMIVPWNVFPPEVEFVLLMAWLMDKTFGRDILMGRATLVLISRRVDNSYALGLIEEKMIYFENVFKSTFSCVIVKEKYNFQMFAEYYLTYSVIGY